MKDLTVAFKGQDLKILIIDGKEWFCVSDIGKMLDLKDPQRRTRRFKRGVRLEPTLTQGGVQDVLYVNEPNLYRLIFQSKKDSAIEFQDWIYEEVIPSIRKTGKYSVPMSIKKISSQNRNILTDAWKECGIDKKHHFIQLTLQEYKALGIDKKKKEMDKGEILLLSALEAMEALKLFNDPKEGYYECRDSIHETASILPKTEKKEIK